MRLLLCAVLLLASRAASAACVIRGARPTVSLPTMAIGQEFSFIVSPDCETLRFTIRGTTLSKTPRSGEQVGPGPTTYKVALTESEWDAVVAESGSTLTWVVTGRTSAGETTRLITTNDLKREAMAIDLSTADAKLVGERRDDRAGVSVSGAGDVDGDGTDDLLIGSLQGPAGAAYLVLGPVTGTVDLSRADAKCIGEEAEDLAGYSLSGAGDVDGDGRDDLLIGAQGNDEGGDYAGAAYLVLGPVTGTLDLALADAKLVGEEATDSAGSSLSDAGDVDGNGHDDLLIGSGNNEGGALAGAAYLVLGPVTGTIDLSSADAKLLGGGSTDNARIVSGAGDVDADGYSDLLVGATHPISPYAPGSAFLVLGPVTGTIALSIVGAELVGEEPDDHTGSAVSGAGDVDSDGHDDILIGAPQDPERGRWSGAAYLVLGPVTGSGDLSNADAKFLGEEDHDYVGSSVSGAGDVDGDGHDDVLVGSFGDAGTAYIVLGPVTGTRELSLADAKFVEEQNGDYAGASVTGAGHVDGDGRADVLIGAHYNGRGDSRTGAAYLLYGGGL